MKIEELEYPETTFWNRLRVETGLRIGFSFVGCENMNKLKRFYRLNHFKTKNNHA